MSDLPPGEWSDLLVGGWWPSAQSAETAAQSASKRTGTAAVYEDYRSMLDSILSGVLSEEKGHTASSAQDAFNQGKLQATAVAEKNSGKAKAYANAADATQGLRSELRTIAAMGNDAIDQVQKNSEILDKVTPIVQIVGLSNAQSGRISAIWSAKVAAATESVLAASGDPRSAQEFARDHGIPTDGVPTTPSDALLTQEVKGKLDSLPGATNTESNSSALTGVGFLDEGPGLPNSGQQIPSSNVTEAAAPVHVPSVKSSTSGAAESSLSAEVGALPIAAAPDAAPLSPTTTGSAPASLGTGGGGITTGSGAPGAFSGAGNAGAATGGGSPALPSTGALGGGSQALSPESLAQSFNSGVQAGAPASAGAEALSQGISDSVQSQPPPHAPPPITSTPTAATTGFAYDAPQHYSEPAPAPAPSPAADPQHQAMYAAPVAQAPAAAPMAAPPPAASAGPLPTYGSDLRPATSAAPPPPAAPAPLSAPVNPASGTAASSQPAVVRQQAATTPATAPTGLVENALTAAATGAAAGAASEQAVAQARLQRLLEAVARQEPKLKWAIGDREDGSTILVTDLASGWIPPHIELPTGVQILAPGKRRGTVEHLLGETTNFAVCTPGHYLPPAKDVEPVQMSFRARQVPDIDELNWEITQAANWRDGLPRLAHTLAKAGVAGTGVLESESDLLYDYLSATRDNVIKRYPDDVDTTDVGNWQLLAAIGGLISKDTTTLKYHFAWFQALSMATQGGHR
jgi:Family of unknown function (DUF5632)/Family of unknown function (DUF5631)